jgi:hypothetical protein
MLIMNTCYESRSLPIIRATGCPVIEILCLKISCQIHLFSFGEDIFFDIEQNQYILSLTSHLPNEVHELIIK